MVSNEKITLHNFSNQNVTVSDWTVKDIAGRTWSISTTINANSSVDVLRNGQSMGLNNSGGPFKGKKFKFHHTDPATGQRKVMEIGG